MDGPIWTREQSLPHRLTLLPALGRVPGVSFGPNKCGGQQAGPGIDLTLGCAAPFCEQRFFPAPLANFRFAIEPAAERLALNL
jgi:hypothetical protein